METAQSKEDGWLMCWRRDVRACHASRLRCSNKRHLAESEFTHGRYALYRRVVARGQTDPLFRACGMYLVHNGTVRETPKAEARGIETDGVQPGDKVTSMHFSYDEDKVAAAVEEARTLPGIGYVRVWLNSGELAVGDHHARAHRRRTAACDRRPAASRGNHQKRVRQRD